MASIESRGLTPHRIPPPIDVPMPPFPTTERQHHSQRCTPGRSVPSRHLAAGSERRRQHPSHRNMELWPHCSESGFPCVDLLAYFVLVVLCLGCSPVTETAEPKDNAETQPISIKAQTLSISPTPWPTIARSQGSLLADQETVVSTKVAGRVAKVNVDLGDYVESAQPLVLLDTTEFELEASQAQALLNQARVAVGLLPDESTEDPSPNNAPPVRQEKAIWEEAENSLRRAETLLNQGAISKGEYDLAVASERTAEARHAAALNAVQEKIATIRTREAELALAKHQIAEAVILAPFEGYIRKRNATPGTYLSVGEPVLTLVRTDPLRFSSSLPERYAQQLKVGLTVVLKVASNANPIEAKITRVSPTLNNQSRVLGFEADIANPNQMVRAGLFVESEVMIDPNATAIAVPLSAIDSFAGVQKVWKVVDDRAVEQEVLLGAKRKDWYEVTSGLVFGDEILLNASEGKRATVQRTGNAVPTDTLLQISAETLDQRNGEMNRDDS